MADAGIRQRMPREFFAGILLARRCDVGMREHAMRGHLAAEHDAAAQRDHGGDLPEREVRIAPVMAAIDDLHTDRAGIDVFLAGPAGYAGVPGALALGHALHDAAVFQHDVMRRNVGACGAELGDRAFHIRHAGVVQQNHVGEATVVAVAIVHRRDDVGNDRGIGGKSFHICVGPGNGKGALTLQINTSRCERTRTHFLNSIRAGERQYGISKDNGVYYSFTLQPAQSGKPGSTSHFAGVWAEGITGFI